MSRVEENKKMINDFIDAAIKNPEGTYEEMVAWHLGTIDGFLLDISKSLAVIADAMSEEGSNAPNVGGRVEYIKDEIEHLACRKYDHKLLLDREKVLEILDAHLADMRGEK